MMRHWGGADKFTLSTYLCHQIHICLVVLYGGPIVRQNAAAAPQDSRAHEARRLALPRARVQVLRKLGLLVRPQVYAALPAHRNGCRGPQRPLAVAYLLNRLKPKL